MMDKDNQAVSVPYPPQPEDLPVFNAAAGNSGGGGTWRVRINPLEGLIRAGDEARDLIDRTIASDHPDYAILAGRLSRKLEAIRYFSAWLLEEDRERGSSAGGFTP